MKIVSIGGGTGQSLLLKELRDLDAEVTAVVTVLDSGRSTAVIRREFNMVAPGDVRNCLLALADDSLSEVYQYRLKHLLEGMSLGNLLLAALTEKYGSFGEAVDVTSRMFGIKGNVFPSTLANTHVCAEFEDGSVICSEKGIVTEGTGRVVKAYLADRDAKGYDKACKAIREADIIIIGPGSWFTSVIVNLLISDIRKAVNESKALKICIPNLATQKGVTNDFSVSDHVRVLLEYVNVDHVMVNVKEPHEDVQERYRAEGCEFIYVTEEDVSFCHRQRIQVTKADLISEGMNKEWNKMMYMRHDMGKVIKSLDPLIQAKRRMRGVVIVAGKGHA